MFKYKRRIRFGDTDPFGIAYFVAYLNYFKEALDEFLRFMGFKPEFFYRNRQKNYAFPIVSCSANYRKPLKYDDEIEIEVNFEIKKRSIIFSFKCDAADGKIVCVCINKDWKTIEIPKEVREKFEKAYIVD